jgi:hypothetical protein
VPQEFYPGIKSLLDLVIEARAAVFCDIRHTFIIKKKGRACSALRFVAPLILGYFKGTA